jgi:hypothetical protein
MTAEISAPSPVPPLTTKPQIAPTDTARPDPAGPAFAAILANAAGLSPVSTSMAKPQTMTADAASADPAQPALAAQLANAAVPSGKPLPAGGKTVPHNGDKRKDTSADDHDPASDLPAQIDGTVSPNRALLAPPAPSASAANPVPPAGDPATSKTTSKALGGPVSATEATPAATPRAPAPTIQPRSRPAVFTHSGSSSEAARSASPEPPTTPATIASLPAQTLALPIASTTGGTVAPLGTTLAESASTAITLAAAIGPSIPTSASASQAVTPAQTVPPCVAFTPLSAAAATRADVPVASVTAAKADAGNTSPVNTAPTAASRDAIQSRTITGAVPDQPTPPSAQPSTPMTAQQTAPIAPVMPAASAIASLGSSQKVAHSVPASAATRTVRAASSPDAKSSTATLAGDLRPAMTALDIEPQPQLPPSADPKQSQAPTDLGTLVDRLIAAKQASNADVVSAHVAHADFGRIDLSFSADAAGVTVGMRSHDPDFAPSVQAATHAAPAQGAATDSRPQQDWSSQGAATSGNTASQKSARDQGRAALGQASLETATSGSFGGSASRPSAADREDPRGIYA